MSTEIICNSTGRETRVAIVEGKRLVELHIDRGIDRGYVGNIYLGKVVRVLPGMQAAFVDIGLDRAAFLYAGDVHSDDVSVHDNGSDRPTVSAKSGSRGTRPPIQDLLKEGQKIIVQLSKDPIGTKGARVTTHIAIAGRYIVYMPTVEHVGISRRISKDKERKRLKDFVEKHGPEGAGFIVRTVCRNQPAANLKADMDYLTGVWSKVEEAEKEGKTPLCVHAEHGLLLRVVRDLFDGDVSRLVVDDAEKFKEVKGFMTTFMPQHEKLVHHYKGRESIFANYGVDVQMKRSLGRKVWLKSGGYLVIDQTEALIAVDVNSGKNVGRSSLEETTLQTNLEAAVEVAYQLRLRNLGGIIIIDFIDMDIADSRAKVNKSLETAVRKDRARTNILKISELGLTQMTRKRVQEGLDRYLNQDCVSCDGTGFVTSSATVCFDVLRQIRAEAQNRVDKQHIYVNCAPAVANMLYNEHAEDLVSVETIVGEFVVVRPVAHYHPSEFEVSVR